ncbi:unnamed protein product [Chrysodeixis includens]|uniref:Uncharacterized protein n=1 Tax=Chrysodeixis includens TaxID=689277 RepID=A0A9P0BQ15_CHRIL|nr:unnamed protein product [Chrysodeixis includens]
MFIKIICVSLFISSVLSRHVSNVPRFADLDEEDQHLFRAAYESPGYEHEEYPQQYQYQEDEDLPLGKLDLFKDGLWAIKAKLKELKAFNKALLANFLMTKLKVKELLASSLALKTHQHGGYEKKKPYNYQTPSYAPQQYGPQYAEAQYAPAQHIHDPYYGH